MKIASWPSGLYFVRLTARDGRTGFAPFIVRPRFDASPRPIAVVLSTNTWQAYNFRDMNGFTGTALTNGEKFGRFGIEADARAPSSPARIKLLARIKDIFGPGKSAEMTYYRTPRGAKVFAAGVLNFTSTAADRSLIGKLLNNLFAKLEIR
jgi:hypothetical protein